MKTWVLLSALPMRAALGEWSGEWTAVASMPTPRMEAAMASLGDGRIAYVGGSFMSDKGHGDRSGSPNRENAKSKPFSSAVLYDSSKDAWTALPEMTHPRDAPGLCVIGKRLYAFGGAIRFSSPPSMVTTYTNTAEYLDIDSATAWRAAPSLPFNVTSPSVTALADGSSCVLAGGFTGDPSDFQYRHDALHFDGKKYTPLPKMPFGRSNMGIAATRAGVYVVGGGATNPSYYNASFLAHDPASGSFAPAWKALQPLNYARSYIMMGVVEPAGSGKELIVAAGGMSLIPMFDPMASVEVYDPVADKWALYDDGMPGSLPTPQGFGSGARINATHMLGAGGVGAGLDGTQAYVYTLKG
jgi:hypothetical protein